MADTLPDPAPPAPTDPRLPLNARQVFKLKKSWKGIKRNIEATGLEMFVRMFRSSESSKQLFKDFRELKTDDDLRMNETLEKHGAKVMGVIDDVIQNIDNVDIIIDTLKMTGATHQRFEGFTADFFWKIEQPFLDAVKITLEDRYSDNMDVIYKLIIKFILKYLIEGVNEAYQRTANNS